jgi:hypothetical protein
MPKDKRDRKSIGNSRAGEEFGRSGMLPVKRLEVENFLRNAERSEYLAK